MVTNPRYRVEDEMRSDDWSNSSKPESPRKPNFGLQPLLLLILTAVFVLALAAVAAAVHALLLMAPIATSPLVRREPEAKSLIERKFPKNQDWRKS